MALQEKYDGAVRVIAEASKDITAAEATIAWQAEVIAQMREALQNIADWKNVRNQLAGEHVSSSIDAIDAITTLADAAIALAEGR